jgi:chitin synthase
MIKRHTDLLTIVRALVEQRLQTELTGDRRAFVDSQIDQELANM